MHLQCHRDRGHRDLRMRVRHDLAHRDRVLQLVPVHLGEANLGEEHLDAERPGVHRRHPDRGGRDAHRLRAEERHRDEGVPCPDARQTGCCQDGAGRGVPLDAGLRSASARCLLPQLASPRALQPVSPLASAQAWEPEQPSATVRAEEPEMASAQPIPA